MYKRQGKEDADRLDRQILWSRGGFPDREQGREDHSLYDQTRYTSRKMCIRDRTYDIEDVPQWVDRVYSADLLVDLFDYYGTLKHGFWNSVLSQKDCLKTTEGYNYLALNDDVWM